jgi:hypothetical protein
MLRFSSVLTLFSAYFVEVSCNLKIPSYVLREKSRIILRILDHFEFFMKEKKIMRVKVIIIRVSCSRSLSPKHTTERRLIINAGLSTVTLRFVASENAEACFKSKCQLKSCKIEISRPGSKF